MRGWYGNRFRHILASRGIRTSELNRFIRSRNIQQISKKEIFDYLDSIGWKYEFISKEKLLKQLVLNRNIMKITNEISQKIENYEINDEIELREYIYELEKNGEIHKVETSILLNSNAYMFMYSVFNERREKEREKIRQREEEERLEKEKFRPYDPNTETHTEYIKRVKDAVYNDEESLFYNPDLEMEEV